MTRFIVRRLLAMVVLVYCIATLVFFLAHVSPNDPAKLVLGQRAANHHALMVMRHVMGIDLPVWQQYLNYVGGLAHGQLGYSIGSDTLGQPVWDLIRSGVPVSIKLGLYAQTLSLLIGLPLGILCALKQNNWIDHAVQTVMITLYALPIFIVIPMCQILFGDQLHWLPVAGWGDPGMRGLREMVLPLGVFALGNAGFWAKTYRSFFLEVLRQDYVRTARAKGLKERYVIFRHAAKNTLLPLASLVGPGLAFLVTGLFILEYLFAIPGVGFISVQSINNSDYPVIEATTILIASSVVAVNALTDIFCALIDRRIRL